MYVVNSQSKILSNYKKTINFIHKKIKKEIDQHDAKDFEKLRWSILNDKYRDAILSKTRMHLFKTCTGSGKSVTSVLWAKYLSIYMSEIFEGFVVLSPQYKNGTNEIERIVNNHGEPVEYVRFEGKNRLCTERETKLNKKGIKVKDFIDNNISISKYCENACPMYGSCKYYINVHNIINSKEKGGIKNWIGAQHQINAILPIYLMHIDDIILIIDEDFTDAIKNEYQYTVPVLKQNKKFLELLLKELNVKEKDDPFRRFVDLFNKVIEIFLDDIYAIQQPFLRYELLIDMFEEMDIIKGIDDYVLNQLENKAFEYILKNIVSPFKFIYKEICNFIDNYMLEDPLENPNINEWIQSAIIKNKKFQISLVYYDKFLLNKIFEKDNVRKVIINDATSEKLILDFLFKDTEKITEYNEDWMYENCEFYQLRKLRSGNDLTNKFAHYPKSSFLHKETFRHLINDIKSIIYKHKDQKILIVAREIESKELSFEKMSLSNYIASLGYDNCSFETYPLAGTNIYSDYDVVILLGRPELPQAVLKRQSILIGMDQKKYRKLYSRNSMIQGMGRIFRGSNHKYVYIITGFDLELNRPIIYYKSHTELQQTIGKYIKERENKNDKENKTTIILNYLKKNNNIDVSTCQKIIKVSNYKATKFLNLLFEKKILKKEIGERGKKNYYI